ncbi:hypothetical protein N431DRAFT_443642 [Stipitochalara longipes BDJ]|nr:hypothetical protein N431DRAFT_443642 [Stipitochalara longipes BDJ]
MCQKLGVAFLLQLPLFFQRVICQYTAAIQYPNGDDHFNIIDTIIVQWNSTNLDTLNTANTNPVLFTWYLNNETDQVGQVAQLSQVDVPQIGTLDYNLQNFSDGRISAFPAIMWFSLFYDTSVISPPNQEGFNGKWFSVYSNGDVPATTWALTTSFAAAPTGGEILPTSTASSLGTKPGSGTSRTTSTSTSTSSPTGTSISHSANNGGLKAVAIALFVIVVLLLLIVIAMWIYIRRLGKHVAPAQAVVADSEEEMRTTSAGASVVTELDNNEERGANSDDSVVLPAPRQRESRRTVSSATTLAGGSETAKSLRSVSSRSTVSSGPGTARTIRTF